MIATARGVLVLVAVAIVLVIVAVVDGRRDGPVMDRALVPDFDAAHATKLEIGRDISLHRDSLTSEWKADHLEQLDRGAVDAMLATLRGARWHRRADRDAAGPIHTTVRVTLDGHVVELGLATPLAGTEQVWVVRGADAFLVDAWVARAFAVEPWQLQVRAPLAEVDRFDLAITESGRELALVGHPRRRAGIWLDPVLVGSLDRALRELTIVGPSTAAPTPERLVVALVPHGPTLAVHGPCAGHPDQVAVTGAIDGCIAATDWHAVEEAVHALQRDPQAIADRRPVPVTAARIALPGGTLAIDKTTVLTVGDQVLPTDPLAIMELVAALSTPGEIVAPPSTPAITTLEVEDGAKQHTIRLELHAPDIVVRRDDGIALRVGKGAWDILGKAALRYRDRTVVREEPTTITSVTVDGTTWERGEVIGEWRKAGGPSQVAPGVEAFVAKLARLDGLDGDPPGGFAAVHHVTLVVTPPGSGGMTTRALELGTPTTTGCPLRIAGHAWLVPRAVCVVPG